MRHYSIRPSCFLSPVHTLHIIHVRLTCDWVLELLAMACNRSFNMLNILLVIPLYLSQFSSNFHTVFTINFVVFYMISQLWWCDNYFHQMNIITASKPSHVNCCEYTSASTRHTLQVLQNLPGTARNTLQWADRKQNWPFKGRTHREYRRKLSSK